MGTNLSIGSGIPKLDDWTVQANGNMPAVWSPTDAGNRTILFIYSHKLWGRPIWSIPQINSVSQSDCKDIAATPIQQIQIVIIHDLRRIQCPLCRLMIKRSQKKEMRVFKTPMKQKNC